MKFWVTQEGHEAEVEFHADDGKLWIELDGRRLEADFARLPDGEVYSLLVDGRSHEVGVSSTSKQLEVSHAGAVFSVEVRHPLEKVLQSVRRIAPGTGGETVKAPMPGLIVAIHVKVGDRVEAGQAVAVVEAMKMQNELAARSAGRVDEVLVAPGTSVSAGQPLLRIGSVPA